MSQQRTSESQTASQTQEPPSPVAGVFLLDEVDVAEQVKIHAQLSRNLDSSYELAIEEAIRRSLLACPEAQPSQAEGSIADSSDAAPGQPFGSSANQEPDMSSVQNQAGDGAGDYVVQRGAAAPVPAARTRWKNVGSSNSQGSPVSAAAAGSDTLVNGMPNVGAIHLNDAEDEDSNGAPRSRRGRYRWQQQERSERRPSLDRMDGPSSERRPSLERMGGPVSERRPSLDRMNGPASERRPSLDRRDDYGSERRPSLDRMNQYHSERRPSLEMRDSNQSERRPSVERVGYHRQERRPSLEQMNDHCSERRPSLDRMERRQSLEWRNSQPSERRSSLERRDSRQSERRPSLERVDQRERRASLDGLQSASECLQSLTGLDSSNGTAQGINTLRPWPLSDMGVPTNWDVTQLPDEVDGMYRLVTLSPIDKEYSAITVDFEEAGLKVVSVERLQNLHLLERFNDEKKRLLKRRPPDFELNERYLYHGTQANKQRLCEEGLDHRLSFQGCFGRGIYFSDNPRKCMHYATTGGGNADTHPMILVCRVLLGESKVYQQGIKDSNLKREPEKPKAKGGWRYYDSVQGIPVDYPEFVVYDNHRSMMEYIVTFDEVGYRAPPAASNFYPAPSLYKVEPITLPIPEEELDRMYMLCPDTDSDGSCDEHTREVEQLRDNVKKAKAKRLGIPYRPPTKEEKRYERLHWKRVCYYSCPPGSPLFETMIMKKKQEKAARKKRKAEERARKAAGEGGETSTATKDAAASGATGGSSRTVSSDIDVSAPVSSLGSVRAAPDQAREEENYYDVENDSVAEVLTTMIAEFLNVTSTDNVSKARRYILDNSMDLDSAVLQYYRDLA